MIDHTYYILVITHLKKSILNTLFCVNKTEGKTTTFMKRLHGKSPPRKQSLDRRQYFQNLN
jgi:hypothetical protein